MATSVTVRSSSTGSCATVVLSTGPADVPFDIRSNLGPFSEAQVLDQSGNRHENRSFRVWESACHSGLLYANRSIGCTRVTVFIEAISGKLGEDEATGFAVASYAGLFHELAVAHRFEEKELVGWQVTSIAHLPTPGRKAQA